MKIISNIGKLPIIIPQFVELYMVNSDYVIVKGKLGICKLKIPRVFVLARRENTMCVQPVYTMISKEMVSQWGTLRALLQNLVIGVSFGFSQTLELFGLGYKGSIELNVLKLRVGTSHELVMPMVNNVNLKMLTNTLIAIKSMNSADLGTMAYKIYQLRKPDVYKGKGVRWNMRKVILKEGKKQK